MKLIIEDNDGKQYPVGSDIEEEFGAIDLKSCTTIFVTISSVAVTKEQP